MERKGNETARLLAGKKEELLEVWIEAQSAAITLREDLVSKEDLLKQSREFLDILIKAMNQGNMEDITSPAYDPVNKMLGDISWSRARQGFTPTETAVFVFSLRGAILQFLQTEYGEHPEILNREMALINNLIDSLGLVTFDTYAKGREEVIMDQQKAILEISTPVMTIWDKILCVPLIGTLDSARTQQLMEVLLQQIVDTQSRVAILDVSGIPTIDTEVSNHLLRTVTATRLLGGECIITGISSRVAQTMVHLGVDLSAVITRTTLAEGLRLAFNNLQLTVSPK